MQLGGRVGIHEVTSASRLIHNWGWGGGGKDTSPTSPCQRNHASALLELRGGKDLCLFIKALDFWWYLCQLRVKRCVMVSEHFGGFRGDAAHDQESSPKLK